jgi:hypothetical protein
MTCVISSETSHKQSAYKQQLLSYDAMVVSKRWNIHIHHYMTYLNGVLKGYILVSTNHYFPTTRIQTANLFTRSSRQFMEITPA